VSAGGLGTAAAEGLRETAGNKDAALTFGETRAVALGWVPKAVAAACTDGCQ